MIDCMLLNRDKYSLFAKKVRVSKGTEFSTTFTEFPATTYTLIDAELDLDVCAVSETAYLVGENFNIPEMYQGNSTTVYGPVWVPKSKVEVISGGDKTS